MSSPVYVQRTTSFRDVFVVQNAAGTFITGLTQASFTLRLSKNGSNQAVAGVTITEISAGSNPGEYAVLIDGTTGFTAADGTYNLHITYTALPQYSWEQTYVVNILGSQGASGVAFTATAGHGRVYDGSNPVASATVVVLQPTGAIYAVQTSDASGLWGPVYFTADGVYTVVAQKSGYVSATSTITVSGGGTAVSGPGTDLTLAASTTNQLSASELWAYFTRMARDVSGSKADTERKQGVQDALDMVAKEGRWNWLLRRFYLTLHGPFSIAATATNGSAVLSIVGTWPTWAASGRVLIESQVIDVLSRDSATNITLDVAWARPSGTYNVILFQDEYALPDDMLMFHKIIPYQRWGWGGTPISAEAMFERQSAMVYQQRMPSAWTVHNNKFIIYPYSQQDDTLAYTCYVRPANLISGASVADWDPAQVEVLRRAIDVQVAIRYGSCASGDVNACMARYKEALSRALTTDREPTGAANLLDSIDLWDARRLVTDWHRRTV